MSVQPVMSEPSKPPPKRRRIACTDDGQTDGYAERQGQFGWLGLLCIALDPDFGSLVAKYLTGMQLLRMSYVCHESRRIPKHLFKGKTIGVVMCNQSEHPSQCYEALHTVFEMCAGVHLELMPNMVDYACKHPQQATEQWNQMYANVSNMSEMELAILTLFCRDIHLSVSYADLSGVSDTDITLYTACLGMLTAEHVHVGNVSKATRHHIVHSLEAKPKTLSTRQQCSFQHACVLCASINDGQTTYGTIFAIVRTYAAGYIDPYFGEDGRETFISFGDHMEITYDNPRTALLFAGHLLTNLNVWNTPRHLPDVTEHLCNILHTTTFTDQDYTDKVVELLQEITSVMVARCNSTLEKDVRKLFFVNTATHSLNSFERKVHEAMCKKELDKIVVQNQRQADIGAHLVHHMRNKPTAIATLTCAFCSSTFCGSSVKKVHPHSKEHMCESQLSSACVQRFPAKRSVTKHKYYPTAHRHG